MWIPHTDAVVVVTLNPHKDGERMPRQKGPSYTEPEKTAAFQKLFLVGLPPDLLSEQLIPSSGAPQGQSVDDNAQACSAAQRRCPAPGSALLRLAVITGFWTLVMICFMVARGALQDGKSEVSPQEVAQMTFSELRDALLSRGALDRDWVRRINEAEADFWRRNSGCGAVHFGLLGCECRFPSALRVCCHLCEYEVEHTVTSPSLLCLCAHGIALSY